MHRFLLVLLFSIPLLTAGCDSGEDEGADLDGDIQVRLEAPGSASISYTRYYVGESEFDLDIASEAPFAVDGERLLDLEDGHAGYAFEASVISGGPVTVTLLSGGDVLDTVEASQGGAVVRVEAGRAVEIPTAGNRSELTPPLVLAAL